MSAGAPPWSVKGIDPKAREIAKDLARRQGLTLGDWLNRVIMEDPAGSADPGAPSAPSFAAEELQKLQSALDRMGERVDSISGVDQSVHGLLARLDMAERDQNAVAARFEGAVQEVQAEQAKGAQRLARIEEAVSQPRAIEALRALEAALGKVAGHVYDSETRTRESLTELKAELGGLGERVERMDEAGAPPPQAMIDGVVSRIVQRLEEAEARTSGAIRGLEATFGDFDRRLQAAEARGDLPELRMEQLAQELSRDFESARGEMAGKLEETVQTRFGAVERSVKDMSGQVQAAERRSTQAMERMGREVLRVAEALGQRVDGVEGRSAIAITKVGGDVARIADAMEGRLRKADQVQAESLERLGTEIARITERLAERIASAERRSAQAIDDVGEQVARITERVTQRHERTSTELAERIRLSEERTVRHLEDAREKIDQRLSASERRLVEQVAQQPASPPPAAAEPDPASLFAEPDLPPGPFGGAGGAAEAFAQRYARRGSAPAGFVPPVESLPPEPEHSPFETDDDFDAAAMFETFNAEADEPQAAEAEIEPEAFDDEAALAAADGATVAAPLAEAETPQKLSTRELIEQARAAARAASQSGDAGAPKRGLLSGLGVGGKKDKKPTSRLKSAMMISAAAAALGLTTAGLTLYSAQIVWHGHKRQAPATFSTPQAAVALAPQVIAPTGRAAMPTDIGADLPGLYADAVRRAEAKDTTAVADLRRAANLGYAPAEFYLAKLYEEGDDGVPKDVVEARHWTERAAEGGERKAMHNLALYNFEGTGGPKNLTAAALWFRKAADLGLVDSQYNLARLYEGGFGVSQNRGEAYKWYLIASRSGDGESHAAAERVRIQLSAEERASADRAARAFHPRAPAVPQTLTAQLAPALGPSQPGVALAQKALARLGYYKGPSDGVASPALNTAVASYQRDQGMTQTGALDSAVLGKLSKAAG